MLFYGKAIFTLHHILEWDSKLSLDRLSRPLPCGYLDCETVKWGMCKNYLHRNYRLKTMCSKRHTTDVSNLM